MTLPQVVLFATGGTISGEVPQGGPGYVPSLKSKGLLGRIPGWDKVARVETQDVTHVVSQDLTLEIVLDLCKRVNAALARPEVSGAVVTHGTGTLEDTCFLLDLFVRSEKPVVCCGAMNNASTPEWDGRRNILESLIAAADLASRGRGATICMNGELHAARDVTKMHSTSVSAFMSPALGPLGLVSEGRVIYCRRPELRYSFPVEALDPEVRLVKVTQGDDTRLLEAALGLGAHGIVIEALGGHGSIPKWFHEPIKAACRKGVPVVICTRSLLGRVSFSVAQSSVDTGKTGLISGGDLPSHKARLLLMAALAQTRDEEAIRQIFRTMAP